MSDIGYLVWRSAAGRASDPCVRDDHAELTYGQFTARVDAVAAQLHTRGVRAGDVIAVMLPNRVELLIAVMAAWRLRASVTPINPAFNADEAEYQIDDSRAALIVNEGPDAPSCGRATLHVDDLAHDLGENLSLPAEPAGSDIALVIYTSGSTGRPKGVELTHSNLHYMATAFRDHMRLTAADHCLLILPLFHVNAILVSFLAPLLAGAQLSITGKFSPTRFFGDVRRLRPTYFSAVPTIYSLLVTRASEEDADLSSLRFAICGAAPISRELLVRVEASLGLTVIEGYGLTEGTCGTALNPLDGPRRLGTVGPALPGQQIAIAGPDGRRLPAGEIGEVLVSGPNVMRGYLGRREETDRTVVDGWLHTGDVGKLDDDGYLTLVDRIKDLIIRGGENLSPKEIENAFTSHPAVLECAVIGVPDDVYGETPHAYVVTYPGQTVSGDDLLAHAATRLAKIKVPSEVFVVDELPKNPVGKIDKPALRRQHAVGAL